ncbi:hypothetical protein K503DRAFT_783058 [Rhizopogon vinicolor AM-OR11-026]|uniref:Ricin B lectin domain-containing protein n=1 Tax=Rhizopogon vinicolor AM-OR11-026 TaxID=1314800 RepID=A0A1B7N016_9AGAM|nr:hypothetical protein K503DRAFT_783058 [Rhizopogon vinicolor AM-OR11-026]
MADLPEPQDYYIFCAESFGTEKPVGLTVVEDEGVLRGISGEKMAWSVQYVDREKGTCTFIHPESGRPTGVPENSDGVACYLGQPQQWTLKKTDDGITVSRFFGDEERFSHIDNEGSVSRPQKRGNSEVGVQAGERRQVRIFMIAFMKTYAKLESSFGYKASFEHFS